ncbi:MAG: acylphosphatase [Desulfobacterales bacterium]
MADHVRAHAIISGKVQGVFFRMKTQKTAQNHGVSGWVKNKRNGTVEAVFEGEKNSVDSVIQWCKNGPAGSKVDDIDLEWEPYSGEFTEFSIRY